MQPKPFLSFIVPVFNEAGNIELLHKELVTVGALFKKPFEIIYVNDGSTDSTAAVLNSLQPATHIELRKNFGQTAALDAGIKHATGTYFVTLDGDGQNNPFDIPRLLLALHQKNVDVVCGWRVNRKDSFSKRFISKGARWLRSFLIKDGIHDSGCTLRIYKAECFTNVTLRGEMHRFIPAILKWRGYSISEIPVHHRERHFGTSKYTFSRTIKGFLDMLSLWFFRKFATRPLHMLGFLGLVFMATGTLLALHAVYQKIVLDTSLSDTAAPLLSVFFILFGVQMFVSGLIMDLIISANNPKQYEIRSISTKV